MEKSGGGGLNHCCACALPHIQTSFVDSAGDIKMVLFGNDGCGSGGGQFQLLICPLPTAF